jgi:hypothetical protein
VPRIEAAHQRAAADYERAAAVHDYAAETFEARGLNLLAARERERARRDRDGATVEHKLARMRRELIARARARGAGPPR